MFLSFTRLSRGCTINDHAIVQFNSYYLLLCPVFTTGTATSAKKQRCVWEGIRTYCGSLKILHRHRDLVFQQIIRMKSYQRPQMKALCTVRADSVCMMYRSIPAATYVVRVGRREGDYGVDNVHESEMRVHHVDLVSSCKGEMVHFFQCPRFFYIKFHVFCVVLEVENLLKPGKNICCVEHN